MHCTEQECAGRFGTPMEEKGRTYVNKRDWFVVIGCRIYNHLTVNLVFMILECCKLIACTVLMERKTQYDQY